MTVLRFWAQVRALPVAQATAVAQAASRSEAAGGGGTGTLAIATRADTTTITDVEQSGGFHPADHAPVFLMLGVILTGLGGAMSVTHPLTANPPVNILFGEPCLWLGVLLLGAGLHLSRSQHLSAGAIKAASPVVFGVGLILAFCAAAIARFELIGAAPVEEPITGLLHAYPVVENTFFVLLYALSAAGALAFPWLLSRAGDLAWTIMKWSWSIAGLGFLIFSALNFYTHIGMMVNLTRPDAAFRF
ncbi:DUF981 family protein [Micromonospora craniellae]|uniref:DUF981 family protein n=1 Tax=Micromonospora craniellae TaxID=2294034 RepID=UPI0037C8B915